MPITTTITHTRPNALVSWYPQTEVFITRMNAFQSAGYILHPGTWTRVKSYYL